MWLAWSLADDAAVDSSPAGTGIRLFFHRLRRTPFPLTPRRLGAGP
jgi:hypothetical protein